MKQGNFDVRKLPQFLTCGVLPYVGSLMMLALFVGNIPVIATIFYTSAATVVAKFMVEVKDKISELII
jgi:hypothetical protein